MQICYNKKPAICESTDLIHVNYIKYKETNK